LWSTPSARHWRAGMSTTPQAYAIQPVNAIEPTGSTVGST
jgi:hypothetical protein